MERFLYFRVKLNHFSFKKYQYLLFYWSLHRKLQFWKLNILLCVTYKIRQKMADNRLFSPPGVVAMGNALSSRMSRPNLLIKYWFNWGNHSIDWQLQVGVTRQSENKLNIGKWNIHYLSTSSEGRWWRIRLPVAVFGPFIFFLINLTKQDDLAKEKHIL